VNTIPRSAGSGDDPRRSGRRRALGRARRDRQRQRWIVHLGNMAAPLAAVMLVDYVVVKRRRIDVSGSSTRTGPTDT
jgi:hypothetical protein